MTDIETHIEKQIPFVLFSTKEGQTVCPFTFFPAELRIQGPTDGDGVSMSAVFKSEIEFKKEVARLEAEHKNFQSLRPTK